MRFAAYPDYQESGVAYLGFIPTIWHTKRLKHIAKYWVSNVNKVAEENETPIRLCNYTDVYYNEFIEENLQFMETTATAEEIARFGLKEGDVVITKDSESWDDIAVPALVKEVSDLVCGYHLAFIRSDGNYLFGKYLFRYLQSPQINQHFQVAATGVTRFGLPKDEIGSVEIALPSIQEQDTICGFLDQKTSQIDTLIRKKEELIEKLQEKRSALISRTVTRGLPSEAAKAAGLNPHPKMKDSGIEWLGEIPEHWEVLQLRRRWLVLDCKHKTVSFVDDGIPLASIREVHGFTVDLSEAKRTTEEEYEEMIDGDRKPKVGDILYSRNATVGDAAIVTISERFCMGQDVCLIRSTHQFARFVIYALRSQPLVEQAEALMIGSTFRRINVGQIKGFWMPLPPFGEQIAIAKYLDQQTDRIDQMTEKVKAAIEKLTEYRSALITAAVTGKIDVRNYSGDYSDARSAH